MFGEIRSLIEREGIKFAGGGDSLKITQVSQWGEEFRLGSNDQHFWGCRNMRVTATDILNLAGSTTLANSFRECDSLGDIPNIGLWDVSLIENFSLTFLLCLKFIGNISAPDNSPFYFLHLYFQEC